MGAYNVAYPGILVNKSIDLSITYCNDTFLRYSGLASEEEALGLTDYDLPWHNYADIYYKHELDALAGKEYSAIIPFKDHKGNEYIFLNNKAPRRNQDDKIIGTVSYAMEVINPPVFEFVSLLQKSLSDQSIANYFSIQDTHLSSRESECLFYLLRGNTAKQIARLLSLSPKTVEHYIENMKLKFHCQTKSELISKAIEQGFTNVVPKSILFEQLSDIIKKLQ